MILPPELADSLKAFGNQQGVTLFMTTFAGFQVLLSRYTGKEDLVVGSVIANRTSRETEELVGAFMNMVVLRTDLSRNPTFLQLLNRVRSVLLGAFAHQDVPFEQVVEALNPKRNANYHPVFQVMFQLRNLHTSGLELANLTVEELAPPSGVSQFDLALEVQEVRDGLRCLATYSTDLFDAADYSPAVGSLSHHFAGCCSTTRASRSYPADADR